MRKWQTAMLAGAIWLLALGARAETILETDFGQADQPILTAQGQANPEVSGVLPAGWTEDSSAWADVKVTCQVQEQDGQRYLRLAVQEVKEGRVQFCKRGLPGLGKEAFYRLTLRARSARESMIEYGVRLSGEPYEFLWNTRKTLKSDWQELNHDFQVKDPGAEIGFWINLDGAGDTVDLAYLKLERVGRDELAAEMKAKYPDGGPANVLRNTRFPLGLPGGWMLWRDYSDGDDVQLEAAPQVLGPSGVPALKLAGAEPFWLRGEPIGIILPTAKHVFSLAVKGEGKWQFSVLAGQYRALGRKAVELKPEADWQRVKVEFMPELMEKVCTLKIEGAGTLYIDALQCGPAEKAGGEYVQPLSGEIALACAAGDAAGGKIQFADEPAQVRYAAVGDLTGATLKAKAVNLYGEEQALPDIALGDGPVRSGELAYDVFAAHPYGSYRVEAWAEKAGRRVTPMNELIVHRLRRPFYWGKDAPDSPFGVHMMATTRRLIMMKAAGVNWTRLHDAGLEYIGWAHLEPEKGRWEFRDKEINRYRQHQIKIFAELGTAPRWASYFRNEKPHSGYFDRFYQPVDLKDYENYVRTVVSRYRGVIDTYFVWNEPWIHAWWPVDYDETQQDRAGYLTSEHAQADFARLQQVAYDTVKAVDPTILVSGINTTNSTGSFGHAFSGNEWTKGVVAAGGDQWCDLYDYHQYASALNGFPEDSLDKGLGFAWEALLAKHGGKFDKPVWLSEGSGTAGLHREGLYKYTLTYDNSDDSWGVSDRYCRYTIRLLTLGVGKVFNYSVHCHGGFGGGNGHAILVAEDGSFHPSGAAHSAMAWHLEDTKFQETVDLGGGLYAYLFAGGDKHTAVLMGAKGAQGRPVARPAGGMARDLFGNDLPENAPYAERIVYLSGSAESLQAALQAMKR